MYPIDKIIEVLQYRKQVKLAKLLINSEYDFTESSTYGSQWNSTLTTVNIYSPIKYHEKLLLISENEKEEIIKAFHVIYPVKANEIEINHIELFVHPDKPILEDEKNIIKQNDADTSFWTEGYFRIFISHSSQIKSDANSLKDAFDKFAICGFVAHDDIEPTKEWQLVIEDALISCHVVVALLNEDFPQSRWTDQEIGIGYGLGKILIPIRMGIDPYGFMGKYQGVQGKNKTMASIASDIFDLLLKKDKTSEQISRAIIHKFINSNTIASARTNVKLLDSVTYMDNALLDDLIKSKNSNSQIADGIGVPYKIDNFVSVWKNKLK